MSSVFKIEDVFTIEQDEDGSYIVTDNFTVVYGHGDTVTEAYLDYIVAFIEYLQLTVEYG